MTTTSNRPIRNGVRPSAFNYALCAAMTGASRAGRFVKRAGRKLLVGFAICYFAVLGVPLLTAIALALELPVALVAFLSWCRRTCRQARVIVNTPVGEEIPAQHGPRCLGLLALQRSPSVNIFRLFVVTRGDGRWDDRRWRGPCPAGCAVDDDFWKRNFSLPPEKP